MPKPANEAAPIDSPRPRPTTNWSAHARADVRGDPAQEARLFRQGSGGARGPVRRTGDPVGAIHPAGDRAAAAAVCRVRRGSLDQDALPGLGRLFDLRDGRAVPLAARTGRRAGAGDPVHLSQSQSTRPTRAPISWQPRSKWSIIWSPTGSPTSWASKRRSGFWSIISRSSPSGAKDRASPRARIAEEENRGTEPRK